MQLPKLLKHFKLSTKQLSVILKKNGVEHDLRTLRRVPENWDQLLSEYTGIVQLSNDKTSIEEKKEKPTKATNSNKSIQDQLKTLAKHNKIDTNQYQFLAYVVYISKDKTNAFVRRINNIINIDKTIDFSESKESLYKLNNNIDELKKQQIVACTSASKMKNKLKEAHISSSNLTCMVHKKSDNSFDFTIISLSNKIVTITLPIKTDRQSFKQGYATIKLFYKANNRSQPNKLQGDFSIELCKDEANKEAIELNIKSQTELILSKISLDKTDKYIVQAYKNMFDNEEVYARFSKQFALEIESSKNFQDIHTLRNFIEKWNTINERVISYELLIERVDFSILYEYWREGKLPFNYWGSKLISVIINNSNEVKIETELNQLYKGTLNENSIETIQDGLDSYFYDDKQKISIEHYYACLSVIGYLPENLRDKYLKKTNSKLTPRDQLKNWFENQNTEFPQKAAVRYIASYDPEIQKLLLEHIEDKYLSEVISDLHEIEDEVLFRKILNTVVYPMFSGLNGIGFDLEVNPANDAIFELAYGNEKHWEECNEKDELINSLNAFELLTKDNNKLFIGHNATAFDCPILEKNNIYISPNKLWDTMLVEMLMSSDYLTFALRTVHHAIDDAKLSYRLFINQLLRLLKLPDDDFELLIKYFPSALSEKIKTLKSTVTLQWLPCSFLANERDEIFRPQPKTNPVILKLKQELNKSNSENTNLFHDSSRVIIAPQVYQKELLRICNIEFNIISDDDDYRLVSENKIDELSDENNWNTIVLKRYLKYCKSEKIQPYWGNLAVYIKMKLSEANDIELILEKTKNHIGWENKKTYFTSISELKQNTKQINKLDKLELFVLDPDLLSVSHKELLKEINTDDILNNKNTEQLWMKFSGGQSVVSFPKEQALNLIDSSYEEFTYYWLEKYQFGLFRIYGTHNWEQIIARIKGCNKHYINLDINKNLKGKVEFTVVKNQSKKSSKVVRYNPETIYRVNYWVYQKKLLQQIDTSEKPIILLVQHKREIDDLVNYFSSLGFFIPNTKMSVARQLERLHQDRSNKKIIIAPLHYIGKILHANYLGALAVVVDSFHLAENYLKAQETELFSKLETKSVDPKTEMQGNEENTFKSKPNLPYEKDTYFLLKLQLPYINYLRNIVRSNNPEHEIWLLDPRITDFPELSETWNGNKNYISIWDDQKSYESDLKEAEKHIKSVKPTKEIPHELNEIKKILSNAFLGKGNDWYDYQHEYLDEIIPGQKNYLVSLPTGAGKSLLFQAPSIFNSSFTNRLTLVITPLKALMQDQVKELWNKGFIGSVEYINSDRSSDVQLIYRALAGGELSLLYITPERFRSNGFLNALNMRLQSDGGLEYVVFDEAHCVSQWGNEFRPDYLNAARVVWKKRQQSKQNFPILLFSATVSEKVYKDFNTIFS